MLTISVSVLFLWPAEHLRDKQLLEPESITRLSSSQGAKPPDSARGKRSGAGATTNGALTARQEAADRSSAPAPHPTARGFTSLKSHMSMRLTSMSPFADMELDEVSTTLYACRRTRLSQRILNLLQDPPGLRTSSCVLWWILSSVLKSARGTSSELSVQGESGGLGCRSSHRTCAQRCRKPSI